MGFLKLYASRDHIHNKLLLIVLMVTAAEIILPNNHKDTKSPTGVGVSGPPHSDPPWRPTLRRTLGFYA